MQERKAETFTVSPYHCGNYRIGYRSSEMFGGPRGISLATAVAISGAAVSPNMGYMMTSPAVRLLMTFFNVRLGWWLGNPGAPGDLTFKEASPRSILRPLLSEAFGQTDETSPYVYLSDGGHFENLGMYEMVLRRCRFIMVSDASTYPEYEYESLAQAIRKTRIDMGSDHNESRARVTRHCRGHDPDGPGAGDENVFAQDLKGERGVHRIAKRIEDGSRIAVDARIVTPHVRHRQCNQFGETPRPVHAHTRCIRAQMPHACHPVAASPAYDVPFSGNQFTRLEIVDVGTGFNDLSHKLMPNGHRDGNRLLRPIVPIEDVNVRSANARAQNTDQNVVNTDCGLGNVFEPETRLCVCFD